jgi:hypothetical protein
MQFCHVQFDAKIIWHIFYSCNPFANYHVLTGDCVANVCVRVRAVVLFFVIVPGLKFEDPVFFLGFCKEC